MLPDDAGTSAFTFAWLAFALLGVAELVEADVLVAAPFAFEMLRSVLLHAELHKTIASKMKNAVNVRRTGKLSFI
jgi:hypothetical protein